MSSKKKGPSLTRLTVMIRELQEMKQYLLPDDGKDEMEQEMKKFDDFGKLKAKLNSQINILRQNITELEQIRSKRGRDQYVIRLQNDNYKELDAARQLWTRMKDQLVRDTGKRKIDESTLGARKQMVESFGQELMELEMSNKGLKPSKQQDSMMKSIDASRQRAEQREKERQERRARAKARRAELGGDPTIPDEDDFRPVTEPTAQEQAFLQEKKEKDEQINRHLDFISSGLTQLKGLSLDMQQNLRTQNELLQQVDEKMEGTLADIVTANKRLKSILKETTGGATQWCPVLVAGIILLGVLGYIFNII